VELFSVAEKLLLSKGYGVLEIQKMNAVLSPDDEVGTPESTTAGCTREGQLGAATEVAPALGLELLKEAQGILSCVSHRWGGGQAGLEGLRILPANEEIPEEGMHGFPLLAGLAAGVSRKVVMGIRRQADVG
jgi:hypothetical protein